MWFEMAARMIEVETRQVRMIVMICPPESDGYIHRVTAPTLEQCKTLLENYLDANTGPGTRTMHVQTHYVYTKDTPCFTRCK